MRWQFIDHYNKTSLVITHVVLPTSRSLFLFPANSVIAMYMPHIIMIGSVLYKLECKLVHVMLSVIYQFLYAVTSVSPIHMSV